MTTGVETASAAEAASAAGGNELPVVTGVPAFSTLEETALVVSEAELLAFASDADGDTLTVVGLVALGGFVSSNGDGTWTFVPDENFTGTAELQYQVYDGTDYVPALATVTVAPVNDAPVVGVAAGGGEAGVNDYTASHQNASAVARLDDGGHVVVWASNGQDGSGYGIYAQRYDADGTAVGPEFRVNGATANSQRQPAVAGLAGGGFVVTWSSTGDGSLEGVYQQRFDAAGAALGGQSLVNETIAGSQDLAQVAGLAGGGHAVVWRSARADGSGHDVYLRAYDAAGAALAGEALVSGGVAGEGSGQDLPVLAALGDGGVLVAWSSADGDGAGVFARRFDAAGNAAGAAFQVNSHIAGAQEEPAVAALADGGFVIAWRSLGQDGSSYGVYAQRYDADGIAVGSEVLVNTRTSSNQLETSVAGLSGGGYVVIWQSQFQDGSGRGVYGQIFDASGSAVGAEFRVNETTAGDQDEASVAGLPDGGFVVTWTSSGQDGSGDGIYQRRFAADGSPYVFTPTFVEDGAAVTIAPSLQLGDVDSTTLDGATVTIADFVAGEDVLSFAAQAGISGAFNAETGVLTLTGTASLADYQAVLRSVAYANTSDNPSAGAQGLSRTISFTVDDGGAENAASAPVSVTVGIAAVNDAPVVSGDVSLATAEDTPLIIAEAELLALASDPDGDALSIQNLTAASGTLANNGDGTWTFTPPAGFDGSVGLSYQISDGELVVEATANVEVVSVANEAPVLNLPQPTGGDRQVNTYTAGDQQFAAVTSLSDGGYVVTWASNGQDGSYWGIYGQRFDAKGTAVGAEFRVNTYTSGTQFFPTVSSIEGGGFVVAWESSGQDGSNAGVYVQRYNLSGSAIGPEFRANTYTLNTQDKASVAGLAGGGFVVTWQSYAQDGSDYGIYAQRFAANGSPVGSEFRVNTFTAGHQSFPAVTALQGGGFIVTWASSGLREGQYGIYGQRFDPNGAVVGGEFRVNSYTVNNQLDPSVAALSDGGFVVTWSSRDQDGSSYGVYAQRYDAEGFTIGSEFRVNTYTANSQSDAVVTALFGGGFVVTWQSNGQDGSGGGVYGQRYDANGFAVGGEFRVNSYAPNHQYRVSVVALTDDGFVVTWESDGQDGSEFGIFQKIYNADGTERIGPSYVEGSEAVVFAGELTISDVDSATLVGATVTIDDFVAGEDELVFTDQSGISGTYDAQTGVLTLSGTASLADYQAALRSVGYRNTSNDPTGTGRDISITVDDGTGATQTSNTVTAHVNVIGVPGDNAVTGEPFAATSAGDADIFHFDAAAGAQVLDAFAAGDGDVAGDGIVDAVAFDAGSGLASFDDVLAHAAQVADDVVIDLDGDASLTIKGVELAQLTADDFRFIA